MKKTTLMILLLSTLLLSEEPTAVSKVMARFSKLSTIESTPIEESVVEEQITTEEEPSLSNLETENLEMAETIKMAKFEKSDIGYPESRGVEKVEEKSLPKEEKPKDSSLGKIEADAKKSALEKINEAMKRVEDTKNREF